MRLSHFWEFVGSNGFSLITIITGVVVIVLDQLGQISSSVVSSTILGLLALLATSEIVESRGKLSKLEEKIDDLSTQLLGVSQGIKVIAFSTNSEALEYAGNRMREATKSVDLASIDRRRSMQTPSLRKYYSGREKAAISNKVKFRYIAALDNERRLNYAWKYVSDPKIHNFYAGFYTAPSEIPLMTFTIFDREEIFTRHPFQLGADEGYISIKSPEVVELFLAYYERLWEGTHKLQTQEDYRALVEHLANQSS